jgi:4-hydroxybenzoate polyprenyltransferase
MHVKDSRSLNHLFFYISLHLKHEFDITVRLMQSNLVGFAFIFIGALLLRVIRSPMILTELAAPIVDIVMSGLLCTYIFDIANQTSSPEEDYLNKPYRPIPAGLITIGQAKTLWMLAWSLGPLYVYHFFGLWAMLHLLHFQALIFACYVWPQWYPWFMRNYLASAGYFILMRLSNQVLQRHKLDWNISFSIELIVTIWFLGSIHIQEFHDLEGDRKSNRTTLPMLLSDRGLKMLRAGTSAFIFVFSSGLSLFPLYTKTYSTFILSVCALQQIQSCVLAYRILFSNSVCTDRTTYHVYYYPTALSISLFLGLMI